MTLIAKPMETHAICEACGWIWKPEDGDRTTQRAQHNGRIAARLHARRRKHAVQVLRRTVYDFRPAARRSA